MFGIAVGSMGLQMELFWNMTPREFHFCYDAWANVRKDDYQSTWEQTRMIIYYQYCSYPKKGQNPTYTRFKAQHLPFPWDRINKRELDDDILEEEPQGLTPNDWLKRIENIKQSSISKKLNANEIKSIQ